MLWQRLEPSNGKHLSLAALLPKVKDSMHSSRRPSRLHYVILFVKWRSLYKFDGYVFYILFW